MGKQIGESTVVVCGHKDLADGAMMTPADEVAAIDDAWARAKERAEYVAAKDGLCIGRSYLHTIGPVEVHPAAVATDTAPAYPRHVCAGLSLTFKLMERPTNTPTDDKTEDED